MIDVGYFLLFCVGVLIFGIWHGMREDRKLHHGVTRNQTNRKEK